MSTSATSAWTSAGEEDKVREIKFRAWAEVSLGDTWIDDVDGRIRRKREYRMLHVHSIHFNTKKVMISSDCGTYSLPFSDIILMQYTGIKDRVGKEIYEGDILDGHSDGVVRVAWEDAGWTCFFDDLNLIGLDELCIWFGNHSIIIGNIYENPELMPTVSNLPVTPTKEG